MRDANPEPGSGGEPASSAGPARAAGAQSAAGSAAAGAGAAGAAQPGGPADGAELEAVAGQTQRGEPADRGELAVAAGGVPPVPVPAAAGGVQPVPEAAAERSDADLLAEIRMLRRRTRSRRHAYWFPLALFGLLIAVSAPFYYPQAYGAAGRAHGDVATTWPLGLDLLRPMFGGSRYAALYWLVALVGGFALTAWWYRRSAGRTGLRTSSRGQLITGIVLVVLLVALPATVLAFPGDLVVRGFIPLLIIAAALWALCPAERSPALYAIAAVYTAVALIVNLYNLENITYRLGIDSQSGWATSLPNVLLPALVLLAASGWAYVSQRRRVN